MMRRGSGAASRRHAACWQRSTTARLPLSYCTPSARLRRLRRVARGGKAADEPAGKAANRTHSPGDEAEPDSHAVDEVRMQPCVR